MRENTIQEYFEAHQKFRSTMCEKDTELRYNQLLTKFRGRGFYLPEVDNEADLETIRELLPEYDKKIAWIEEEIVKLKKRSDLSISSNLKKIENHIHQALKFKKIISLSKDQKEIASAALESKKIQEELFKDYKETIPKISFLTHYHFPIDHLKNRKVHDEFKSKHTKEAEKATNYSFMFRKLVEDGAYNPDHTGSDMFLRTTMDTLFFELQNTDVVFPENSRVDLKWVMKKWKNEIDRGKSGLIARLEEWLERTKRQKYFYETLINPENVSTLKSLVQEHNQATLELKKFVYERETQVYKFWHRQPEELKKLFVLDTILYNEVGDTDAPYALDRMDVAKVVINRSHKQFYQTLDHKQELYPYLVRELGEYNLKREVWLNLLFRGGEFSFTYYYIPGVVKMFCPDMSKKGKQLQKENVEIAHMALHQAHDDFKPTRYFSRASMLGRINMSLVWDDFLPYPERPGVLEAKQKELQDKYLKNEYEFLYLFKSTDHKEYQAIEIENKIYTMISTESGPIFYTYRNPHNFIYFTSRNSKK